MKKTGAVLSFVLAFGLGASLLFAQGQSQAHRRIVVPDSSVEHPGDRGKKAHTNHLILVSPDTLGRANAQPLGETPSSLACVYNLVRKLAPGCPVATSKDIPSGGNGTIAIVGAYDYPTAYDDLSTFSKQFGLHVLPQCSKNKNSTCFQKVFATGSQPPLDCGWAQEAALDIEWAHAMAPNASIVLVEAATNSIPDLLAAVDVANAFVNPGGPPAGTGLGQVSMSWGAAEFIEETDLDSLHFTTPGVVYFAASGDVGGSTMYPGASPSVVSVGGTSLIRDAAGNFTGETAWSNSGGGTSLYELNPSYQDVISALALGKRAAPDIALDADPNTGVSVYDSTPCQVTINGVTQTQVGWQVFGGTSVSTPTLAGIVNLAGSKYNSTDTELSSVYACYASSTCYQFSFRDILTGSTSPTTSASPGWDFATGVGSPIGLNNK